MNKWMCVLVVLAMSCGDSESSKKGDDCTDCVVNVGSAELSVESITELLEGGPGKTSALKLKRQPMSDVKVLNIRALGLGMFRRISETPTRALRA